MLQFLLRNPQKMINKDELLNAIWGGTAISENSKARGIALLRRFLGDVMRQPTIHAKPPRRLDTGLYPKRQAIAVLLNQLLTPPATRVISDDRPYSDPHLYSPHLGQVVPVPKTGLRGDLWKCISKSGHGNDSEWKARKPGFHPSHTPWKSFGNYHIPAASTAGIFQGARA
jgi:hypothetical protein